MYFNFVWDVGEAYLPLPVTPRVRLYRHGTYLEYLPPPQNNIIVKHFFIIIIYFILFVLLYLLYFIIIINLFTYKSI